MTPLVRPPDQSHISDRRCCGDVTTMAGQVLEVIKEDCEVLANDGDDRELFQDGEAEVEAKDDEVPDVDDGFLVRSRRQPAEAPGNGEDEEIVPRRVLPDPGQPTEQEYEEHCVDHANYRSWCKHCVRARGRGEPHRSGKQRGRGRRVPCFQFDYMFVTRTGKLLTRHELLSDTDEVTLKILVAKDSYTKSLFAHVVDKKGLDENNYVIDRLMEDLRWLGYVRVALRSDNEPAIVQVLKKALVTAKVEVVDDEGEAPAQVMQEHSARYDSQSNGDIEVGVRDLKGILTANKLCLEERLGRRVPSDHMIMAWLVEHAAWIITTRRRGEDGLSAYQRVRGRDYLKREVGFGEMVMRKLPRKGPEVSADLQGGWQDGVVLGYSTTSHEYWVFANNQVVLCRDVKRRPGNVRWNADAVAAVNVHRHDLHKPKAVVAMPSVDVPDPQRIAPKRNVQRILLKRHDFVDFGLSESCPKCEDAQKYGWSSWGQSNKNHTEACRARIENELKQTADGKRRLDEARLREDRWLAKQVEMTDLARRDGGGPQADDGDPHERLGSDYPVLGQPAGHPEEGESSDLPPIPDWVGRAQPSTPPNSIPSVSTTIASVTARRRLRLRGH